VLLNQAAHRCALKQPSLHIYHQTYQPGNQQPSITKSKQWHAVEDAVKLCAWFYRYYIIFHSTHLLYAEVAITVPVQAHKRIARSILAPLTLRLFQHKLQVSVIALQQPVQHLHVAELPLQASYRLLLLFFTL
jgi:hypothetical protein